MKSNIVVQVNGKEIESLQLPIGISNDELESTALMSSTLKEKIRTKSVRKVIIVPGQLINFVIGEI